jgi:cobalamin biosynthesis protein CobT
MADKRIIGQDYSDEDEDEDEGDDDEAEHSDDGDSDELEHSDKDGSDEVEHSDENDDSVDDHVFIGVFNPRHSRGESTFPFHAEIRSDGMGYDMHIPNRR